jgi:hypothetical protein
MAASEYGEQKRLVNKDAVADIFLYAVRIIRNMGS